ncbi:MAG: hypothetical protein GY820_44590 [Gammaproteobacteria bacterium]|nr:hypothetical protein [Gammaproteobacteria bacterium]
MIPVPQNGTYMTIPSSVASRKWIININSFMHKWTVCECCVAQHVGRGARHDMAGNVNEAHS